jgi:hypothetical protein
MNAIEKIQSKIQDICDEAFEIRYAQKGDLYEIDFISEGAAMPVCEVFFEQINKDGFAEKILTLTLDSADEGINGTNAWDLAKLAEAPKVIFKNLKKLVFPLNEKQHNRIIITGGDDYDENGIIGKVLTKMPQIEYLQTPSAPSENFFRACGTIKHLVLQTGYQHQNFIHELSKTKNLQNLESLEFWDYSEFYMLDYEQYCTPVGDYLALFGSVNLPKLKKIILYNTLLTEQDQRTLKSLPLALQLEDLQFISK